MNLLLNPIESQTKKKTHGFLCVWQKERIIA